MDNYFEKVRDYLLELDFTVNYESEEDGVIVVEHEEDGIKNCALIVSDPLVIIEQYLFDIKNESADKFKKLLMKSRDIIHGAFVLDESGKKVLFRNTHELENLDLNEIEATFNALAMLLSEYTDELIELSK